MQFDKAVGSLVVFLSVFLLVTTALSQQTAPKAPPPKATLPQTSKSPAGTGSDAKGAPAPAATPVATHDAKYVLGPGDEIVIIALDADEISNRPIRIGTTGDINLPLISRIQAGGMTVEELEAEITKRLKTFVKEPQVAVNITQFKSQPVTVIGSVGAPGMVQLEGHKTLLEVLSLAGGIKDDAGYRIKITRRAENGPIPLPTAEPIENGYSVAEVNIRGIINATDPQENIEILPFDTISVPKANLVYVMGEVKKAGGFVLNDKENISVIQALALAEGLQPTASKNGAKIYRPVPGANRIEISLNLGDILKGKAKDPMLQADDILVIPDNYAKGTMRRTLETTLQAITGLAIYRW